jgi:hypothetical protein
MFDEAARVVRGGGKVIIKDLARPARWKAALLLTFTRYLGGYSRMQQQMYRESLGAALTVTEVRRTLQHSGLAMARVRGCRGLDYIIVS